MDEFFLLLSILLLTCTMELKGQSSTGSVQLGEITKSTPTANSSNILDAINSGDLTKLAKLANTLSTSQLNVPIDDFGNTMIGAAAALGKLDMVKYLYLKGADPYIRNNLNRTAVDGAIINDVVAVFDFFLDVLKFNKTLLGEYSVEAVWIGSRKLAYYLMKHEADPNYNSPTIFTPLEAAVYGDDNETALMLIEAGANVDIIGLFSKRTPLMIACGTNSIASVRLLLDKGAHISLRNPDNGTALLTAIIYGNAEIAKMLLDAHADVNERYTGGRTPMMMVSLTPSNKSEELARVLLERNVELDAVDNDGLTALIIASIRQQVGVVKLLLIGGANVNVKDLSANSTALIYATLVGDLDIMTLLLDKDADFRKKNGNGTTALMIAANKCNLNATMMLIDKGADIYAQGEFGYNALMAAASSNCAIIVNLLIDKGADVNTKNGTGFTALGVAVVSEAPDCVRVLLNRGARVDTFDTDKQTLLIEAAYANASLEIYDLLIDGGVDTRAVDVNNETALIAAITLGREDVVRHFIIRNVSDITDKDVDGNSVVSVAVHCGFFEIADFLLEIGAELDAKNKDGNTTLISVVQSRNAEAIRYLLDRGANVNVQNDKGDCPLGIASLNGDLQSVLILLNNKADVSIINQNGDSPITLAARSAGNAEVMKVLLETGAYLHTKNAQRDNALTLTAVTGDVNMTTVLIRRGIDVHVQNNAGDNALIIAARNAALGVVMNLTRHGIGLDVKNKVGDTALIVASSLGYLDVVKALVEAGADFGITNNIGQGGVAIAARNGFLDVLACLIAKGESVDAIDFNGKSALMHAVSHNQRNVVYYLISQNANVNIRDSLTGRSALGIAAEAGNFEYAKLLVERGASVNSADFKGRRPLHKAAIAKSLDVTTLLLDHGADIDASDAHGVTAVILASWTDQEDLVHLLFKRGASKAGCPTCFFF